MQMLKRFKLAATDFEPVTHVQFSMVGEIVQAAKKEG